MQLWGRKAKMSRDKYFSTKKSRLYILTQESLLEWRLPEEKAGEVMYDQILFNQEKGRGFRLHGGGGGSSSRDDYGYIYIYIYYYQCTTTFVTLPRGLDRYVSPIMKTRIDYS
ncbi:hypothetical protein Bca4012_050499 [Brassica carinata]